VADDLLFDDLYAALRGIVAANPGDACPSPQVVIADSKRLYQSRGSIAGLEHGVLSALSSLGQSTPSSRDLWRHLAHDSFDDLAEQEWFDHFEVPLPLEASALSIAAGGDLLRQTADRYVRLVAICSTAIFPEHFNRQVAKLGTKGALLSRVTLDLVAELARRFQGEPMRVVCDKHGGRNNYAALIQPRFEDRLVRVAKEGRAESCYDVEAAGRPVRIEFRAKGESFPPAALASMTSKYLRELSMLAFNRFWQNHVVGLESTAGYPADAERFRRQIEPARTRLGISDERVWRQR
jgi:hypothetical protein